MFQGIRKYGALVVGGLATVPVFAQATAPDFTTLTTSVDFSTVATGVLAIAALMVVPKVAAWGAKKVIGFIRG